VKLIDRAIDHVTNRVLDRIEERRPEPQMTVNNINVGEKLRYARAGVSGNS